MALHMRFGPTLYLKYMNLPATDDLRVGKAAPGERKQFFVYGHGLIKNEHLNLKTGTLRE